MRRSGVRPCDGGAGLGVRPSHGAASLVARLRLVGRCSGATKVNVNVLPCPSSLCTVMSPPRARASRLLMTSPRPVPIPFCRPPALICTKGWNRLFRSSLLIPTPASDTEIATRTATGPGGERPFAPRTTESFDRAPRVGCGSLVDLAAFAEDAAGLLGGGNAAWLMKPAAPLPTAPRGDTCQTSALVPAAVGSAVFAAGGADTFSLRWLTSPSGWTRNPLAESFRGLASGRLRIVASSAGDVAADAGGVAAVVSAQPGSESAPARILKSPEPAERLADRTGAPAGDKLPTDDGDVGCNAATPGSSVTSPVARRASLQQQQRLPTMLQVRARGRCSGAASSTATVTVMVPPAWLNLQLLLSRLVTTLCR